MKSLTVLWNDIADDLAMWCRTSTHRDKKYVSERSKCEGLSFLTITLPNFAKDFELCLERGYVGSDVFLSFRKNASLPAFLQGFSCLIFDRGTGVLLSEPNTQAIQAIRQLTLLYSKILLECEPRRIRKAFSEFIECEQEVRDFPRPDWASFSRMRSILFSTMFSKIDHSIYQGSLRPKHGPGATADGLYGNQKYRQTTWPCRLEAYFPFLEMVLPGWSWFDQLEGVNFLEPGAEIPVKVISVPKTMKTPRIIAIEPTAMQYAQQAVLRVISEAIERSYLNDFIGLNDQTPNQRLCREGSLTGDLATLDLSEASDRVSSDAVSALLFPHSHFYEAVFNSRSRTAHMPSGEIISLAKFASMGSALCFPMEAMVFLNIVFLGIEKSLGHRLTKKGVKSFSGRVRIFGDDIIVPKEHVHSVIESLEAFGLKVNRRKSFWNGKFRESCGKEYYDGTNVSIVRCRRVLPESRRDGQAIISTVSLRNQLFCAGYERAVDTLDHRLRRILRRFPQVGVDSPVLGRLTYSVSNPDIEVRNSIPMVKGWIVRSPIPINEIDDWPALRKSLSLLEERGSGFVATSPDHLRRSGRPRVVDIKLGMGTPGF